MRTAIALSVLLTAMAQSSRPGSRAVAGSGLSFYPLGPGASWTWRITEDRGGVGLTRTEEVLRPFLRDGVTALEVRRSEKNYRSYVYLAASVERVVEYHSSMMPQYRGGMSARIPPRLLLECPPAVGKSWDWSEETPIQVEGAAQMPPAEELTWYHHSQIVALDEPVTVPAGTFRAVKVQRSSRHARYGEAACTTWFAPGVGIVKEVEGPRTLELSAFTPPRSTPEALTPAAIARQLGLPAERAAALRSLSSDDVGGGLLSSFLALDAGERTELVRVFREQAVRFDATAAADWNRLIEQEQLVVAAEGMATASATWSELATAIASLHGVQTGGGRLISFSVRKTSVRTVQGRTLECTVELLSNTHKAIPRTVQLQLDGVRIRSFEVQDR